uniref:Proline dehydrogenase n=1 Tax=Herpetomonas muscarum TaxID=5718 RepID=U5KM38_HERMU|nr:proline dehydrogenase [Herpetomonas muscarum]
MRRFAVPSGGRPAASAVTGLIFAQSATVVTPTPRPPLCKADFDDPTSYQRRSTWYLIKALGVLQVCSIEYISKNSVQLMKMCEKVLGKTLTYDVLVKHSVYDYFCAGQHDMEVRRSIERLRKDHIGAVLDYAAEADADETFVPGPGSPDAPDISMASLVTRTNIKYPMDENVFDENMKLYMMCIMHSSLHNPVGVPGVSAVKVTGMCDPQLLARMSAILMSIHQNWVKHFTKEETPKLEECRVVMGVNRKHQQYVSNDEARAAFRELACGRTLPDAEIEEVIKILDPKGKGRVNYFRYKEVMTEAVTAIDPTPIQLILANRLPQLTATEKALWKNVVKRMSYIASTAKAMKVRMLVDAEQTFYQLAIDAIVTYLQKRYNDKVPVVYNTYQCYLTYAEDRIANDLVRASLMNFQWGGKIVRGAYIEQERRTANQYSYTSPIWPTYEETSACYDQSADRILKTFMESPEKKHEAFFGTHNRKSLEHITSKVLECKEIQDRISFGQLYGMRDNLTIPLAKAGFNVFKYLPYGPVRETVHYLGRRAVENRTVLKSKDNDEPKMIKAELLRRFGIRSSQKPPAQKIN